MASFEIIAEDELGAFMRFARGAAKDCSVLVYIDTARDGSITSLITSDDLPALANALLLPDGKVSIKCCVPSTAWLNVSPSQNGMIKLSVGGEANRRAILLDRKKITKMVNAIK